MVSAAELVVKIDADTRGAEAGMDRVNRQVSGMGGTLKTALGTGVGMLGAGMVTALSGSLLDIGKGLINANAQAEQLGQSLEIAVGDRADDVYKKLQKFAAQTPFEFPELVQSTVNLENFGIRSDQVIGDTGRNWTQIIGDTASAMGKTYDQVTQAVLDASTGEYERLKELGVKASVEGDKVRFSYMKNGKQMVAEADRNNSEMIQSTLAAIWNDKYEGAMEKQSKTFNGQMATFRDNINMTMQQASKGLFEFTKTGLKWTNSFFDRFGRESEKGFGTSTALAHALKYTLQDAFGKPVGNQIFGVLQGISDGVRTIYGWGVKIAQSRSMERMTDSLKKMGSAAFAIGKAFRSGGLAAGFKAIFGADGRKLLEGFGDAFSARFKSVGDILKNVTTGFAPLDRVIQNTGKLFTDMGRIVQEVFQGDWDGAMEVGRRALRHLGEEGKATWDLIKTGIDSINWGAVAGQIGDFASGAWSAIQTGISLAWDQITDLNWDNYITKIGDFAGLVGSKIVKLPWGEYLDAAGDLGKYIAAKIYNLPWGMFIDKLGDLGKYVGAKIYNLPWGMFIDKLGDLGKYVGAKIYNLPWGMFIDKIADFGALVAAKIYNLPWGTFIEKIADFGSLVAAKITNLPWGSFIDKVADFGSLIAAKIYNLPWGMFLDKIADFHQMVGDKILNLPWGSFIDKIADFAELVGVKIPNVVWSAFFGAAIDLLGLVTKKIPSISWVDFIPSISKDELINIITLGLVGGNGDAEQQGRNAAGIGGDTAIYDPLGGGTSPVTPSSNQGLPVTSGGTPYRQDQDPSKENRQVNTNGSYTLPNGTVVTTLPTTGSGTTAGNQPMKIPAPDISLFTSVMQSIPQIVGQRMSDALSAATTYATATGTVVGTIFGTLVGNVGALMGQLTNNVGQGMSNALSAASVYSNAIYTVVSTNIGTMVGNVAALVGAIPGIIVGAMNDAASQGAAAAYNAGLSIGAGLANGMDAMITQVQQKANELANAATSAARAALIVQSPSKVFYGIGQNVGEGLALGIESQYGRASGAGTGLANASIPSGTVAGRPDAGNSYVILVTPDSEQFSEIARLARRGGRFAEDMPRLLRQSGVTA